MGPYISIRGRPGGSPPPCGRVRQAATRWPAACASARSAATRAAGPAPRWRRRRRSSGSGRGRPRHRGGPRPRWIGRSADARAVDIGRVVRDHRFPILPGVRVNGLALHVPPMAVDRVADDREARYSVRPVAAYTHVGKEHTGHGHRGAGRAPAGSTSGRRGAAGTVMVPAPEDGWREEPHHMDRCPAGTPAGPCDGAADMGLAGREYGRSGHTDGRVRRRIAGMGRAWMDSMGEDPPVIFPTGAGRKADCRPPPDPGAAHYTQLPSGRMVR